jgi:hypothetical protein
VSHLSALQGACVGTLLSLRLHRPPTQRTALCAAALRTSSVSILLRAVRFCTTPVATSTTCAAISAALGAILRVALGLARLIIRLHGRRHVMRLHCPHTACADSLSNLHAMLDLHRLTGHTHAMVVAGRVRLARCGVQGVAHRVWCTGCGVQGVACRAWRAMRGMQGVACNAWHARRCVQGVARTPSPSAPSKPRSASPTPCAVPVECSLPPFEPPSTSLTSPSAPAR